MKITLLAFGIAKDILHDRKIELELPQQSTTSDLVEILNRKYPALRQLVVYRIAINDEYSAENTLIHDGDEIAIIPPVSGG